MANIGIAKASYYADTSIGRLNRDLDNSVDRVATARKNVTASDIASLKSMDYSFRLDFAATKAAVKSMSVTQAYLSTAISSLENSAAILAKIHGLAVLGANGSNSDADQSAINNEANELADEFHKSMIYSNFKGEKVFQEDGFDSQMSLGPTSTKFAEFGTGSIDYDFFYDYENPNINTLDAGVNYEVTRDLTDAEKEAILSRTTGLSADSLVKGAKFTTNPVEDINRGGGSMSVISENAPINNTKTYNRGDNRIRFDAGATVEQAGDFKGGFLDVEVTGNIETSDTLSLQNTTRLENGNAVDSIRITNGIVSYNDPVHGFIDIGKIVDETNGANGKKLRIELFNDASIPGTGILENGNFEKPVLNQGLRPTKTYTPGELLEGAITGYNITGGNGYQSNGDQPYTGLGADSDTLNLSFVNLRGPAQGQGNSGSGFRASVTLTNGAITNINIIDRGSGYIVGDVLTLANDALNGTGAGFELTITSVDDRVELITSPSYDQIPAWERQTNNGMYSWGESYNAGDRVKEEVNNQNDADETRLKRHIANGTYAWGENYSIGDVVKEQVGNANDADDTVYVTQTNGGMYSWGESYNAGDRVKEEVNNQNDADNTLLKRHIANGTYAWGENYSIGDVVKEQVGNANDADNTVYVRQTNGGTYSWGESYNAGDIVKEEVNNQNDADNTLLKRHIANGTYAWGENYSIGDVVKEQVGNANDADATVYRKHTTNGNYSWGEAYAAGDIVKTRTQTGTQMVDDLNQPLETGGFVQVEQPIYRYDNVVDYYTRNVTVHTRNIIDAYTKNVNTFTKNSVDYYTRNVQTHTRNVIDYYTRNISVFTRDKVGVYTRNLSVHTRLVTTDPISRYLGEINQDPQPQVHTGWTQGTSPYIQNWYYSDNNRVLFGPGNSNGSFTITDTENGSLITSNTTDGSYTDNSKTITVPTPSWQDMASPKYADYEVNAFITRSSNPALEDRDDHPLQYGPGVKAGNPKSTDPSINLIDSNGGKAVKLDTGYMEFQSGNGFGIYHGPAIVSDPFTVTEDSPKIVRLDYTAAGVNDDYHVAGYIYEINPNTGAAIIDPATGKAKITMAVNETDKVQTAGRGGIDVPNAGTYRFVFVVGTHDLTGGLVAGADMTVDNIVAEDPYEINGNIIQELLRAVHYENSAAGAAASKTLTATAESGDKSLFLRDNALINMAGFDSLGTDGPYMIVPSNNLVTSPSEGATVGSANKLTAKIELVQEKLNIAMMNAVSQYKAIESAMESSTDLRSQFALASGTLSDLNFSQETAYIAKRQIQQDIATTMLAQANKNQLDLMMLVEE